MTMKMIGVRMPSEHIDLIKRVCKARGEDLSDFVRRAIYKELADLNFLPEEQKKALGLATAAFKKAQEG
jgi:uncharacterized protein (DUF1778 family)